MLTERSKTHLELLEILWFEPFDSLLILEVENYSKNKYDFFIKANENIAEFKVNNKIITCFFHELMDKTHKEKAINELLYFGVKDNKKAIAYFHATYCLIELILNGADMIIIEPYLEDRFGIKLSEEIKMSIKNYSNRDEV